MSKNDVLEAIRTKLEDDVPSVTWTRRALFENEAAGQEPIGCVVGETWRARGEGENEPRIWDGTIAVVVYARHQGTANEDMHALLDSVESALDGAEIDGAAALNITEASVDQDDLQTGRCKLITQFTVTI